jgi:hypothetical protein
MIVLYKQHDQNEAENKTQTLFRVRNDQFSDEHWNNPANGDAKYERF